MNIERVKFLDWLNVGVRNGVITETKAKELYDTKFSKNRKTDKNAFLKMLYNV